jgi:hypothetical protein
MDVMTLIYELKAAGLELDVAPDGLHVTPRARITPELRERIRAHKTEILAALQQQKTADDISHLDAHPLSRCVAVEVMRLARRPDPDHIQFAMNNHA